MDTRVFQLQDGTRVEVAVPEDFRESATGANRTLSVGMDALTKVVSGAIKPLQEWIREPRSGATISEIEVSLRLNVDVKACFYIASTGSASTVEVKVVLRPTRPEGTP